MWFKGGTSLSKGFGLNERFSEDIDTRMDAGSTGLTDPKLSWKNKKTGVEERNNWFDARRQASPSRAAPSNGIPPALMTWCVPRGWRSATSRIPLRLLQFPLGLRMSWCRHRLGAVITKCMGIGKVGAVWCKCSRNGYS
jgi:hypothetical protein